MASRRRRAAGFTGLVVTAVLVAACGSSSPSASSSTSEASTSTTAATTTSTEAATTTTVTGGGSGGSGSGGTISSVVFTGPTSNPTVTVNGTNLGQMPAPNPSYTPEGHQLCPVPPSGNQGYDYGTSYYLFDSSRNWAGGRYRPEMGELDCIGLITSKFSATQVVFQFGSAYTQYGASKNFVLAEGDSYEMAVNGAVLKGAVHYTG